MSADHAGWIIAANLISVLLGVMIGRIIARKSDCERCGIDQLKIEIANLGVEATRSYNLLRALAEKVGMTVKEQLELENLEKG